jgi:hypothetical protein
MDAPTSFIWIAVLSNEAFEYSDDVYNVEVMLRQTMNDCVECDLFNLLSNERKVGGLIPSRTLVIYS